MYAEPMAVSPAAAAEAAPAAVTAPAEAVEAAEDSESMERQNMTEVPACVHVVNTRKEAQRVADLLTTHHRHQVYGADTEVNNVQMSCVAAHSRTPDSTSKDARHGWGLLPRV